MSQPVLNFPAIIPRYQKNDKGTVQLFDAIRKKFIDLTPEEWVRQHLIHFLIENLNVPKSKIAIEKQLKLNNTIKRTDVLVYDSGITPLLLIECKAPEIELNQATINQVFNYNLTLQVPFILLSNGLIHIFIDNSSEKPQIVKSIPSYTEMLSKI